MLSPFQAGATVKVWGLTTEKKNPSFPGPWNPYPCWVLLLGGEL